MMPYIRSAKTDAVHGTVNLALLSKVHPRPSHRGVQLEFRGFELLAWDANHSRKSPTRHATTPPERFTGLGALPALIQRRHVLRETGTRRGILTLFLISFPIISFSRISAESGRVSKKLKSVCDIVNPHDCY